MRILLIACSYPPDPAVGSFRAAKLANAFVAAGHEVDVITSRSPADTGALRVDEPRLRVHVVRELPGPQTAYRRLKVSSRRPSVNPATGDPTTERPARSTSRWKRYVLSALWVPDNRKGFVPAAVVRARPLLRRGVDLVYTTAPPFSTHLAGLWLRRVAGVPWVAEFRDPWIENKSRPQLRSEGSEAVNRWLERKCVRNADCLVAVSEGTRELLAAKLEPRDRHKVLLALNGIDNLGPRGEAAAPAGPFRIVHLGNCYAGRDPRPFMQALAGIVARRALTATDVQLELIGNCRHYEGDSIEQLAHHLALGSIVRFSDWIPQEEARSRARSADLLLLPFPKHQRLIPNKLYDYLGFRKPILAFVHPEGETARLLRRLHGHYLVTDGAVASAERALDAAMATRGGFVQSAEDEALLQELTTERQMQSLLAQLAASGLVRQ